MPTRRTRRSAQVDGNARPSAAGARLQNVEAGAQVDDAAGVATQYFEMLRRRGGIGTDVDTGRRRRTLVNDSAYVQFDRAWITPDPAVRIARRCDAYTLEDCSGCGLSDGLRQRYGTECSAAGVLRDERTTAIRVPVRETVLASIRSCCRPRGTPVGARYAEERRTVLPEVERWRTSCYSCDAAVAAGGR